MNSLLINIPKKQGKLISEMIDEIIESAKATCTTGGLCSDSMWRGYVETSLKILAGQLESGVIIKYEKKEK